MDHCKIFLLSPANSVGRRAEILMNSRAFDLALRFQDKGASIGEVFSFLSGLYFRGKLAYANRFTRPPVGRGGVFIITANRGLVPPEMPITPDNLRSFSKVPIDKAERRYLEPLIRSCRTLTTGLPLEYEVILLGSVGTKKYAAPLLEMFKQRLKFPSAFVGRGDMSRGGLLLRSIDAARELDYVCLDGAVLHGKRPPKLEKRA